MRFRASFLFLLLLLFACHDEAFERPETAPFVPWTTPIVLRDSTTNLDGFARPDGGWFVTPIHGTVLPDGRVLVTGWGRAGRHRCINEQRRVYGVSFLLDPSDLNVSAVDHHIQPLEEDPAVAGDVLYCSGHAPLADGRVLFVGGAQYQNLGKPNEEVEGGLTYARVFDPASGRFVRINAAMTAGPPEAPGRRWYPTVTRLLDGKMLVTSGFTTCCPKPRLNLSVELFDPEADAAGKNPWTTLLAHDDAQTELAASIRDYPHVWETEREDGAVVMLNSSGKELLFRHNGGPQSGRIEVVGGRPGSSSASDTTAVRLPDGQLMTIGGTGGPEGMLYPFNEKAAQRADVGGRGLDLGINRFTAASVLLPDGTVLVLSGEGAKDSGDSTPQIIDPETLRVTTLPAWPAPDGDIVKSPGHRGYHNLALLLKDGRVLVGGGANAPDYVGCERADLQIFSPPYLAAGHRPQVTALDVVLTRGGAPVDIAYDGSALKSAMLIAPSSFTHGFDQNARAIPLRYAPKGRVLTLTPPDVAPPGFYFLFLIGAEGAPSQGVTVRLQ